MTKRISHRWELLISDDNLYLAFMNAKKGKKNDKNPRVKEDIELIEKNKT